MTRLAIIALLLSACTATDDGMPVIGANDGRGIIVRETDFEVGLKKGPAISFGFTIKWGEK